MMKRIIVIGGGISGLTAAHRLAELSRETGEAVHLAVLEAQDRLGGVIDTAHRDGFVLEGGPDAFLAERPWATALCERLGLSGELIETTPHSRRSFIVRQGKLVAVPEGFYLMAPGGVIPLLRTPLLTWPGKIRMACEPLIPPSRCDGDESVGSFVRRRFGREAMERIGQPMVAGIYTADPEQLSLQAAMPRWYDMERRYGSVGGALRAKGSEHRGLARRARGCRYDLFLSLRGGLSSLVDALIRHMPGVRLCRGVRARRVTPGNAWSVLLEDGRLLTAEAVCVAVPASHAAPLLRPWAADVAQALAGIPYESVATVNVAFRAQEVPRPLDGFGCVVPSVERRRILGCTVASLKFPGRAPDGFVLLRAFVGGAFNRDLVDLNDEAIVGVVRKELRELLAIDAAPSLVRVRRYHAAMPQYHLGHLSRVAVIEEESRRYPGLALTGNGYRGIGIPECIRQAELAAERLWQEVVGPTGRSELERVRALADAG